MNLTLDELAKAAVEPDWPVLDQAGYEALPTSPPYGGGYFRGQDKEGHLVLAFWEPGHIAVIHCCLWGVAAERRN
jgi:hypothetical protein